MEYSSAEMICVLKVNSDCAGCKEKLIKVLKRIHGVYSITMDGEEGTVKVSGRVNPNTLLTVLENNGKHAKVKYVKFEGEVFERNPNYYGEYEYFPYDYGMENYSYPPPLPFLQPQVYHPSQPPSFPPPRMPYPNPLPFRAHPQHQQPPPPPMYGYGPPPPTSFFPPQRPPPPVNGNGPPHPTSFYPPQHQPPPPPPPPPPPMNGNGPSASTSLNPLQHLPKEENSSKKSSKQKKISKLCVIM